MMDTLTTSNLEDTLRLEEKPEEISERNWDKMNMTACGIIRSYLIQDIKYHVMIETSTKKIWEILEGKYLIKSVENHLQLKRRLYCFQLKKGISISEHGNNYTKLLADLANMDVVIEEKDKTLILLNYLPDEDYETFILILINGKQSLDYNEVSLLL